MDRLVTATARRAGARRRDVLLALLAVPLAGCALPVAGRAGATSGADPSSGGGPAAAGGGDRPSGRLVVKHTELLVVDAATGSARSFPTADTSVAPGVGVSRSGVLGDVWGYDGPADDAWHFTIRSLANEQLADWTVGTPLAFPTSAATIDVSATRAAWSVNEPESGSGDAPRIARTYVYDLQTGEVVHRIDRRAEPVLAATGELLTRNEGMIHVHDADYVDQGPTGLEVSTRAGAFDVSPDGRHVVAEFGDRLQVLDRTTGKSWRAADELVRGHTSPTFSPDGRWLAFLREGALASQYLAVVPFTPGTTYEVTDADHLRSPAGDFHGGIGRIGWAP